ncbi:MAG: hypothetical protein ACRDGJ_04725, partial [Candidatus Limnocylindria bacterium]
RAQLAAHLRGCPRCRATRDAFVQGRRLVAGLRHVAPPRDLHARVRAGVVRDAWTPVPWWRRPAAVFAGLAGGSALVAAALLAVVVLTDDDRDQVAQTQTPAPSASIPATTSQPEGSAQASLSPTPPPGASSTPLPGTPASEPQIFLAVTVPSPDPSADPSTAPVMNLTIYNVTPSASPGASPGSSPDPSEDPVATLPPVMGPPIAAALSPNDGEWLAYMTDVEETGTVQIWLARDDGEALGPLAKGLRGSPFVEQMSWSPDGRYLAFTIIEEEASDPEGSQDLISDVWVVDTEADSQVAQRLTDIGRAIAGTFDPDGNLWLSIVQETATSHLLAADALDAALEAGDALDEAALRDEATLELANLFQPLVAPDGSMLIAWQGRFDGEDGRLAEPFFSFTQDGAPYLVELAEPDAGDEEPIADQRPLFADLEIGRDAFRSAAIAWGPNSKSIAVWDTAWTGTQQEDEAYPDPLRVYFGRSTYASPIDSSRVLDADDLPPGIAHVVDVAVAPDGRHLSITVSYPRSGSDAPRADLILIKRNLGTRPDEKHDLVDSNGWEGPAVYPYEFGPGTQAGQP